MKENPQQKTIYPILGMARSGTSAIARGLQALGVDLGAELVPADQKWNAKGFFEDNDIVYKINRSVLNIFGDMWPHINDSKQLYLDHEENLKGLKRYAIDLLKLRMANTDHWGFKDPRTAQMLPFWQEIFGIISVEEKYIIALRNPLASAHSYQRVSGEDLEVGLLLWLAHLVPAIEQTQDKLRVMVSYEYMMQDPRYQLSRIQKALNIPLPINKHEIDVYVNEFLDKDLQHYAHNEDDFKSDQSASVIPLCMKMYAFFTRIARDDVAFDSEEFKAEWKNLKAEFDQMHPIYGYMNTLLKRNKALSRELRDTHKSLPWKLIFPLRILDDALRQFRKKSRQKKRLMKSYG